MHCPQCGVNIPSPGKTCPACHASLLETCPHCLYKNLIGQQFCGNCDADLLAKSNQAVENMTDPTVKIDTLSHYPVLSVELMNLELLGDKLKSPAQLTHVTRDLLTRMESQLVTQNATIESIRDNVIFFSFRHGVSLMPVLSKAMKVGIALAKKTIHLQGVDLRIRVGMDLVHASERGPVTAVPERLAAKAGDLVVSFNVYQLTNKQLPYEPIGPIQVQGEMRTFFKMLHEQKAPSVVQSKSPVSVETQVDVPTTPGGPRQKKITALSSMPKGQTDAHVPSSVAVATSETREGDDMARKFEPEEQPRQVAYTPIELVSRQQPPKKANIGYHQVYKALETEFLEMQSNRSQKGRIIGLSSAEGLGKSTILTMLQGQVVQESMVWLGGGFYEHHAPDPFPLSYWIELIQNLLGIPTEGVPANHAEAQLNQFVSAILGGQAHPELLDFLRTLLAIKPVTPITPEIRFRLGRMIPHFYTLLTALAQSKPVVLILENLEYADSASLELLLQLLQAGLLESRITLVLTYTPDTVFLGPLQQAVSLLPFKEFVLDKIDEQTIIAMAEPPLAVPWKKLPDALRAQMSEKGSPMFLEEGFRWLQLRGGFSIHPKSGQFSPEKKLKTLAIPENLMQVVQERFAGQDDLSRYIMQVASVLGERFSTSALASLSQAHEHFEEMLKLLWQNGFIAPDVGAMVRFRHRLIWQVAYNSMDAETRNKLHQLAAEYFEQARANGMTACPLLPAIHRARAGDVQQAVPLWNQAGVWLADVGSVTAANVAFDKMQHLQATAGIVPPPDQQRRMLESLGVLNLDMNPDYAKNLLLQARQMDGHATPGEQLQVQVFLAQAYERLGAFPNATSTIHRALESLPAGEHAMERIAIGSQEVWTLYLQGRYQEALYVYQHEVKPWLSKVETPPWEDPALRLSFARGELARARAGLMQCVPHALNIAEEAMTQCDLHNEPVMATHFRLTRCWGFLLKGNYDGCQREMEHIIHEIERLGNLPELMAWWGLVAMLYHCDLGDWQNASMLLPSTSYQAEQARDYLAWCLCKALAGRISMSTGNLGEAQKLLEQTVTVAAEYHLSQPAVLGWLYIAQNELALGNAEVAEQVCTRAIEVAEKPQIRNQVALFHLTIIHARILLAGKEYKQAGSLLEKHWPAMVKSGYTPILAEAAFTIAELYGRLAAELPEPHKARYLEQQAAFQEKAKTLWQEQGNQFRLAQFRHQEEQVSLA